MRELLIFNLEQEFEATPKVLYTVEDFPDATTFRKRLAELGPNERHKISVMVVDWMLPDLPGLEIIKEAHRSNPSCPTIILSARSEEKDMVEGLQAGAFDYVSKPFSVVEIAARIHGMVKRREASTIFAATAQDGALEIAEVGENFRRIPTDTETVKKIGKITEDLVYLTEVVRGDNAVLGVVLKKQLVVTLRTIVSELEGEFVDIDSVEKKAGTLSRVGEKVSSEAVSKGIGNLFRRASDLIFDLITNL
ncbi:hypothetical protein NBRC116598_23170 [Pseudophaeobacter arcticus]|uniref:Response regulatory domain-containing protein n=2 Tax=Pseudophaeobacter arcticus TaxID=385492 RepID=A0ABQ0ALX0_9RHOB